MEGNGVVFDHGLISMLEVPAVHLLCAGSYENPGAEGTWSKARPML